MSPPRVSFVPTAHKHRWFLLSGNRFSVSIPKWNQDANADGDNDMTSENTTSLSSLQVLLYDKSTKVIATRFRVNFPLTPQEFVLVRDAAIVGGTGHVVILTTFMIRGSSYAVVFLFRHRELRDDQIGTSCDHINCFLCVPS